MNNHYHSRTVTHLSHINSMPDHFCDRSFYLHSLVFYARGKHFLIVDVDFCKRRASDSFLIDQWNRREEYRFENDGLAVGNAKT